MLRRQAGGDLREARSRGEEIVVGGWGIFHSAMTTAAFTRLLLCDCLCIPQWGCMIAAVCLLWHACLCVICFCRNRSRVFALASFEFGIDRCLASFSSRPGASKNGSSKPSRWREWLACHTASKTCHPDDQIYGLSMCSDKIPQLFVLRLVRAMTDRRTGSRQVKCCFESGVFTRK